MDQISGLVLCSKTDFSYEWWRKVYGNFKAESKDGSTSYYAPPVIFCGRRILFSYFLLNVEQISRSLRYHIRFYRFSFWMIDE